MSSKIKWIRFSTTGRTRSFLLQILALVGTLHTIICQCNPLWKFKKDFPAIDFSTDLFPGAEDSLEGMVGPKWETVFIVFCCAMNFVHWLGNTSHQSESRSQLR